MEAAFISGTVTIIGFLIAYFRWKHEVNLKFDEIKKEITSEIIKQRFRSFSALMINLEITSSIHKEKLIADQKYREQATKIYQDAIYGEPGLLASHETRQILIIARLTSEKFENQPDIYDDWRRVIWASILALRNDLGIPQPKWNNILDDVQSYKPKHVVEQGPFGDRWLGGDEMENLLVKISNLRHEVRK